MIALDYSKENGGLVMMLDDEEARKNQGRRYRAYPPESKDGFVRSYYRLGEAIRYAKTGEKGESR